MRDQVSRRSFLGAAGALAALPATATAEETSRTSENIGETPDEYPREKRHGGFAGSLLVENYGDVEVGVTLHPHQMEIPVALELYLDGVNMSASVEPDQARVLGRSLLAAADEVEEWREKHWDDRMRQQAGGNDADE